MNEDMGRYLVTAHTDLSRLEPRLSMYEVSYADRPRIIAGFVFIRYGLRDFRDVDGSRLNASRSADLIAGMTAAIDEYAGQEAGR